LARVVPLEDSSYSVTANSSTGDSAERGALTRTEKVCSEQDKTIMVHEMDTQYCSAGKKIDVLSSIASGMGAALLQFD